MRGPHDLELVARYFDAFAGRELDEDTRRRTGPILVARHRHQHAGTRVTPGMHDGRTRTGAEANLRAGPKIVHSSASDVAAQRAEVQVAVAVGGGVLPHVLDLAVLVVAVVAELTADARLLVTTERLRRRDHVVVGHPHGAGTHRSGDRVRTVEVLRPHSTTEAVDR